MKKLIALLLIATYGCAASPERVIKYGERRTVKIGIIMDKGVGVCSGALISSTGIVLTCAHCFEHGAINKVFIKMSDETVYPAALLAIDQKRDLALIVPNNLGPFPYFKFGKEPIRGQQVISLGSPLGIQHTATIGWVDNIVKQTYVYIFHSAFVNPGNSGGPLLDLHGRLIGINEAMVYMNALQAAQGLFVAIDIVTVKEFLQEASYR